MLVQHVTDDSIDQRSDRQSSILLRVGLQDEDSVVGILEFILSWQTAKTFTGAAASATSSTFFLRHNRDLNRQPRRIVRKML
jgi:hypothetical protein